MKTADAIWLIIACVVMMPATFAIAVLWRKRQWPGGRTMSVLRRLAFACYCGFGPITILMTSAGESAALSIAISASTPAWVKDCARRDAASRNASDPATGSDTTTPLGGATATPAGGSPTASPTGPVWDQPLLRRVPVKTTQRFHASATPDATKPENRVPLNWELYI